jgi:arylsulfatase A-like enzyme
MPAPKRALAARGALLGAAGGIAAGALDYLNAHAHAASFLPSGSARLALFLVGLYGAAMATAGALAGALAGGLGWATDLGPLWRRTFEAADEQKGARIAAYLLSSLSALGAVGLFARGYTLFAIQQFHHRWLIAALVGAATAGVSVALMAAVFLVAAALSPLLPFGPRARLSLAAPPAIAAAGWTLGFAGAAGGVAALVLALEQRVRMPAPVKALNVGLWAPALVAGAFVVAHLAARLVGRRVRAGTTPLAALGAIVLTLAVPLVAAAAVEWTTVRQLDGRPWQALAFAAATTLVLSAVGVARTLGRLRAWARALVAVATPALLLSVALSTGRSDRVRKAAAALTGAAPPLVLALHTVTDLDRDGYSSVLGGGDCNDLDRSVHPGAFDWPDDGIDQDCNGHEATLAPPPPRVYAAVPPSVPSEPNVILITMDAVRADHVGAYGYPRATTPNLDALAKESVLFKNGWAHAPSTRYSVPAILTGRYPSTIATTLEHWPPKVVAENRLLAEILKDHGYRTGATLSYYYFERGWGLDQGFDDYDYHLQTLHSMGGDPAATRGSSARELADLDIEWLQQHASDKFFLWTHFYDTHFMFEKHAEPETHFGEDEPSLYDGEIRYTDIQLGRLFDTLHKLGLWDKTIIIVTSDHGDGFGEHGIPTNRRHGYHLYRNETKVPMLMRVPGVAPRTVELPVGHIDLIPTLLNALRRPSDEEPQLLGQSVLGVMTGAEPDGDRPVYQEVWFEGPTSLKAVVNRKWHLIRNLVPDDTTELYDQVADPAEDHDRAGEGEPAERGLLSLLGAWMDQTALPADFRRRVEGNVSEAALPVAAPLGDSLGGWLTVEGTAAVAPARRGDSTEVTLILHGTGRVPEGWHLFTHFIAPTGRILNADHEPLEGAYPLERLHAGVWLRDRIKVKLPPDWPPGPTTVLVGLWRRGARAEVRGAHASDGAVRAATIPVSP